MPVLDSQALIAERVHALRRLHRSTGIERAQLDLSGGIDSAVMLGLLTRALGPDNVIAVHSSIESAPAAGRRAAEVARVFGVSLCVIDLTELFRDLTARVRASLIEARYEPEEIDQRLRSDPTVLGSLRSTLRAPVGRAFNRFGGGGIRHGTGNECEDRWLRFYQKGGDGEVDTNPLAMLSKSEVIQLGVALGVPRSVLLARPSPDLWGCGDDHNDEVEIASILDLDPTPHRYYGKVGVDSGECERAGLIERTSRLDDELEGALFSDETTDASGVAAAEVSRAFAGVDVEIVRRLIPAARRIERATRHKHNPAITTLGDRVELVRRGILTNELPSS